MHKILLVGESHDVTEQWRAWLSDTAEVVIDVDQSDTVEVIVTDQLPLPEHLATQPALQHAGTIFVSPDPAESELPPEIQIPFPSQRELQIAAGLVAQLATLRRSNQQAILDTSRWMRLAQSDPLTQLPNRRVWESTIKNLGAAEKVWVVLLDLDNLKEINDTLGHNAGNEVLRQTAKSLQDATRHDDLIARIGGDEFGVLLRHLDDEFADETVERIRQAVCNAGDKPARTATAGYVVPNSETTHWPAIIELADQALIQAKSEGKNRARAGSISC
ncbi:MAG: diguanylate cyclase (GGDEF)-like protein [Pirellulaceae bacterium]|jgi:diguanylate cyclase (GGDEF)-like protein